MDGRHFMDQSGGDRHFGNRRVANGLKFQDILTAVSGGQTCAALSTIGFSSPSERRVC